MRMIGHEVLLKFGDSTSRILPIEKKGKQFQISFASEFMFEPKNLQAAINSVAQKAKLNPKYIIEIISCENETVVYSYKIGGYTKLDILPCGSRAMEKACYKLYFTPLGESYFLDSKKPIVKSKSAKNKTILATYFLLPLLLLVGWGLFARKKKVPIVSKDNLIRLGKYSFDRNNMLLSLESEQIELTSKEAELLALLHESVNVTIKREEILNKVWGDEGDYIGRTLDVFISKLRKKLEADPNVKIANIRGVGYRLILDTK